MSSIVGFANKEKYDITGIELEFDNRMGKMRKMSIDYHDTNLLDLLDSCAFPSSATLKLYANKGKDKYTLLYRSMDSLLWGLQEVVVNGIRINPNNSDIGINGHDLPNRIEKGCSAYTEFLEKPKVAKQPQTST